MSKTSISAKLEPKLLEKVDTLARKLKTPRNRALEEGLELWVKTKSRELLAQEMRKASLATRKESREINKEWEFALLDGLEE